MGGGVLNALQLSHIAHQSEFPPVVLMSEEPIDEEHFQKIKHNK